MKTLKNIFVNILIAAVLYAAAASVGTVIGNHRREASQKRIVAEIKVFCANEDVAKTEFCSSENLAKVFSSR